MIQWLVENTDKLITSANMTTSVMLLILGTYIFYLLYIKRTFEDQSSYIKVVLTGSMWECYGWAFHRLYYALYRGVRVQTADHDAEKIQLSPNIYALYSGIENFLLTHGYISLIPGFMILLGISLIFTPLAAQFFDNAHLRQEEEQSKTRVILSSFVFVFSIFWLFYWQL